MSVPVFLKLENILHMIVTTEIQNISFLVMIIIPGKSVFFCRRIWKVQDPPSDKVFSPPNFHIDEVAMHQHP